MKFEVKELMSFLDKAHSAFHGVALLKEMLENAGYTCLNEADRWHYMGYEDGRITSIYLDPADGMSKSAVTDLVVYAADKSCVDLLTVAAPAMIAEELNVQSLLGANAIWGEGKTLLHTEADANIYLNEEAGYTVKIVE